MFKIKHVLMATVWGAVFMLSQANGQSNTFPASGNVGIGTTTPSSSLQVSGGNIALDPDGTFTSSTSSSETTATRYFQWTRPSDGWTPARIGQTYGTYYGGNLAFDVNSGGLPTSLVTAMTILQSGNVGIGTTSPAAKLDVNGNVKISGAGANLAFPDSTVQSTAWTGVLSGGDYAESVDVTGERTAFEPGDLLVINPKEHGRFQKASTPYSTLVGGVYATKPGVTGRRQPRSKSQEEEVPMAMVGIVPTKVSAENGSIHDGDLLVSSSTPGYAMKGTDRDKLTGAVLGKALGTIESGSGVIEVLISLQ